MPKTIPLADDVRHVLERSEIGPRLVRLPEQLERELYLRVDKVLRAAGGAWHRPSKAHCFAVDPRELLGLAVAEGSIVNTKQSLQAFDTPSALADRLVAAADLLPGCRVLEPSAGVGHLVHAIDRLRLNPRPAVTAVEVDATRFATLDRDCKHTARLRLQSDFLALDPSEFEPFDRVVMNPPFSENQDIRHAQHAYRFLRPGGLLVAVMSPRAFSGSREIEQAFQAFVANRGTRAPIEAGAFKDAGTDVRTVLVTLRKPSGRRPSPARTTPRPRP